MSVGVKNMKTNDVRILFPGLERVKRLQRGQPPTKYVAAPSFDDMVKCAHHNPPDREIILQDVQDVPPRAKNPDKFYSYLLKDVNHKYGYLFLLDGGANPYSTNCASYRHLQYFYEDLQMNVRWYETLDRLVAYSERPDGYNRGFIEKVRATFAKELTPKPAPPPNPYDKFYTKRSSKYNPYYGNYSNTYTTSAVWDDDPWNPFNNR